MSDYIISIVIAFVFIAAPLALVPLLDLICPLSGRLSSGIIKASFQKSNDFLTRFGVMRYRFAKKWGRR